MPDDAIRSFNDVLGKQATSSILAGEVVSSKRFQELPISLEVPAGLTAVSVPAKDVSALGGAVSAGLHVDIYSTGNTSTTLIAQNILVLATSSSYNESSSASVSWITLGVKPSIVQELVAASQNATLYFTLPSEADVSSNSNSESGDQSSSESDVPVPSISADTSKINGEIYE